MASRTRKSLYLGIDLGTTNSKAAVFDYRDTPTGQLRALSLQQHEDVGRQATWQHLPSVVRFDSDGKRVFVGEYPRRSLAAFPDRTVRAIKRFMGKSWRRSIPGWPTVWTPEGISGLILRHLRGQALEQLHDTLNELVTVSISVPASFGSKQREATRDAARLAGFDGEVNLIDEPSAALIHYLYDSWQKGLEFKPKTNVMVFDMGGGTLDVSLARVQAEKDRLQIDIISRSRYTELAGTEFDLRLAAYIVRRLNAAGILTPKTEQGKAALYRAALYDYAETFKVRMSNELGKYYRWGFVIDGMPFDEAIARIKLRISPRVRDLDLGQDGRTVSLPDIEVTFDQFEQVLAPYFELPTSGGMGSAGTGTLYGPIVTALSEAKLSLNDVDVALLHGGMTRLPLIKAALARYFPPTTQLGSTPDPMTSVAQGAAIYQASRDGRQGAIVLTEPELFESVFLEQDKGFKLIVKKDSRAGATDKYELTFDGAVQDIVLSFYHGFSETDPLLTHDHTAQISLSQPLPDGSHLTLRWKVLPDRSVVYECQSPSDHTWQPLIAGGAGAGSKTGSAGSNELKRVIQSIETC